MDSTRYSAGGTTYRLVVLRGPEMAPIVPLFRSAFGRGDFTLEWLKKKYACPFVAGGGFSCVALTESGEAASAFGVLPWPIGFGSRTELAAQLVDAATDKRHRHRGLFTTLGETARELCEKSGISFLFAFPQPAGPSYGRFIRHLGYARLHDLVEYRTGIRTVSLERIARRLTPVYPFYLRQVARSLRPAETVLANSLIRDGFAATDRSPAFHAYKGFAGSRTTLIAGGRAWLKVRFGLMVGDLEAESEAELESCVAALRGVARRLGTHQIVFQSSPGTRFSKFFEGRFTSWPCVSAIYRNLGSAIPPDQLRFTFGDLDNF